MRTTSFISFSQKYAAAMSGRRVTVTFGGTTAYTDNHIINLPTLPAGTMMTAWETRVMTGYLDHEVGHIRYTDWKGKFPRIPSPGEGEYARKLLTHHLFNVFEDVRMENTFIEERPPVKLYLDAVEQHFQDKKRDKGEQAKTTGAQILEAIYHEAYTYRSPDVIYIPGPRLAQMPELAPVKNAMTALANLESTAKVADLAEQVYDLLPKNADYGVPAQDPKGIMLFILGSQEGNEEDEVKFTPIPALGQQGELNIPIQAILDAIKATNRPDLLQDFLASVKAGNNPRNASAREKQKWGDTILPPADTSQDRIFVPTRRNVRVYEATRTQANDQITAAKKMLQLALRVRTKRAWERGLPEGRLDHEVLASLWTKNTNLFKERRDVHAVDTAVQVMVDLSGSMNEEATRLAAIILAEALQGIRGLELSIAGFTTGRSCASRRPKNTGRLMALEIPLFKDFNEPYATARERLGALRTTGSTPLGEAFALGMERLIPRKEPRKVLWPITDGEPALHLVDNRHNEYHLMEKTYRQCQERGIKVVLFNIGELDPKAVKCADAAKAVPHHTLLPGAMMEMMRQIAA